MAMRLVNGRCAENGMKKILDEVKTIGSFNSFNCYGEKFSLDDDTIDALLDESVQRKVRVIYQLVGTRLLLSGRNIEQHIKVIKK